MCDQGSSALLAPGSWTACVWMLRGTVDGGVTCLVDRLCLGVYACLDTKALALE